MTHAAIATGWINAHDEATGYHFGVLVQGRWVTACGSFVATALVANVIDPAGEADDDVHVGDVFLCDDCCAHIGIDVMEAPVLDS